MKIKKKLRTSKLGEKHDSQTTNRAEQQKGKQFHHENFIDNFELLLLTIGEEKKHTLYFEWFVGFTYKNCIFSAL